MRALLQRVSGAAVHIDGQLSGQIADGLLILLGIEHDDDQSDIDWLVRKIVSMRIFSDDAGKMNLSIKDIGGAALVVSQFTLHASTRKGHRPSFIRAARPTTAIPLYEGFVYLMAQEIDQIETGQFGADMKVSLINDGPVTIWLDSKNKE